MNTMNIEQEMTPAEMAAEIIRLRALAAKGKGKLTLKVSEKGAVSLYGMGRFPLTLYKSQWNQLIGHIEVIKEFIALNDSRLAVKE